VPNLVTIASEMPLQDDVRVLIAALNENLLSLTPTEFCSHLKVEQMAASDTTVFIARHDGQPIGCGPLRHRGGCVGEVKRMYTRAEYQGQGTGGRVLEHITALAKVEGLDSLVLETGDRHPAAWHVDVRAGFERCSPVLDYPDSAWSVFYTKEL